MNDITPLFQTLRDDIAEVRAEFRADLAEVRAEVKAISNRPTVPAWVRAVAIGALGTVVTLTVTKVFSHVSWSPAPAPVAAEVKR